MINRFFANGVGALAFLLIAPAFISESPVADAAKEGDIEAIRMLVSTGADVNEAQGDGMTGLHWAALTGSAEIAAVLIDAGADISAVTRIGGHTPLHVASRAGYAPVVQALLTAGARSNEVTSTGVTPLHFAAAAGSADAVQLLLHHGAEPNAREPEWGQTPLMFAAAADRADAIPVLITGGADPSITARVLDIVARNDWDTAERRTRNARLTAIRAGETPSEVQVEARPPQPNDSLNEEQDDAERRGGEPIPPACSGCLGNYAELVGTHGGLTPLLLAAREGHEAAAFALWDGGADINQASAADGTTPILIALINGHFDLGIKLLEAGADPNLASTAGATPLYAALNMEWSPKSRHPQPTDYRQQKHSYLEVMEILLSAGVDPNPRLKKSLWFTTYNRDLFGVDRTGATPFWRAAHALDIKAMKLLLTYGANPDLPTIKRPSRRYRYDITDEQALPSVDASGLPPVPVGGPAVYPVHAAAGVGYGEGFAGNSHRYVPDAWLPTMKFLVEELGADVNARDHNGYSPVHHAAARGDNELIHYLVGKGADVTFIARNGQTTIDLANGPVQRIQPFPETIALLESMGAKNNHKCVSC